MAAWDFLPKYLTRDVWFGVVSRGFNGEFFDLLATQKLRRNLDRARILMDLTRRRSVSLYDMINDLYLHGIL